MTYICSHFPLTYFPWVFFLIKLKCLCHLTKCFVGQTTCLCMPYLQASRRFYKSEILYKIEWINDYNIKVRGLGLGSKEDLVQILVTSLLSYHHQASRCLGCLAKNWWNLEVLGHWKRGGVHWVNWMGLYMSRCTRFLKTDRTNMIHV